MTGRRRIEYLPIADVTPADRNPKGHDDAGIDASISAFGYTEPILLDERTGKLVAGHGRLRALARAEDKAALLPARRRKGAVPDGVELDSDGRWLVPVVRGWSSLSDAHAEAYLVASNRLVEAGGWDELMLAGLLSDVDAADPTLLAATGYSDVALAELLDRLAASNPPDDGGGGRGGGGGDGPAPLAATEPVSRDGDVWLLGPHKLAVGDCTDPATWRRLLGGADDGLRAALLWTDPPFSVDYAGKSAAALRVAPADGDDAPLLFADALEAIRPYLAPGAHFYVCHADRPAGWQILAQLNAAPWRWKQSLVWVMDRVAISAADHQSRHERVAFGQLLEQARDADRAAQTTEADERVAAVAARLDAWADVATRAREAADCLEHADLDTADELLGVAYDSAHELIAYGQLSGRRGRGAGGWYGDSASTTVFEIPRPGAVADHPTAKPIDLVSMHVRASSRRGQIVLDPFAGSGTTVIACAREGRLCRAIEIDPIYADSICRRWQAATGEQPILERTGEPVSFPALVDAPEELAS